MNREPSGKRSYRQHCGLAKALDAVGQRWTLLLVRELLLGPRRWSQLLDAMPGLTTNLLAKRLAELQAEGIVERVPGPERDPEPGRRGCYRLTERGRALEPAILELGRWGAQRLTARVDARDRFDLGWALISSKRRYRRGADRVRVVLELGASQRRFQLRCDPGYLDVHEGAPWRADLVLDGEQRDIVALWFGGAPACSLLAEGRLALVGDEALLADVLASFEGIRWSSDGTTAGLGQQ